MCSNFNLILSLFCGQLLFSFIQNILYMRGDLTPLFQKTAIYSMQPIEMKLTLRSCDNDYMKWTSLI